MRLSSGTHVQGHTRTHTHTHTHTHTLSLSLDLSLDLFLSPYLSLSPPSLPVLQRGADVAHVYCDVTSGEVTGDGSSAAFAGASCKTIMQRWGRGSWKEGVEGGRE